MPGGEDEIYKQPEEKKIKMPVNQVRERRMNEGEEVHDGAQLQVQAQLQVPEQRQVNAPLQANGELRIQQQVEAGLKKEKISQVRQAFDEELRKQEARTQRKQELQAQILEIRKDYSDDSAELDDIIFISKEDSEVLANAKNELQELEKQEQQWETEIQEYVKEGAEYKRDFLLAKLEWIKPELSEEQAEKEKWTIETIYRQQKQRDDKEAAQKAEQNATRISELHKQVTSAYQWLNDHKDVSKGEQKLSSSQLNFLSYFSTLSDALSELSTRENEEQQNEEDKKARDLVEELKPRAVAIIRETLMQESAYRYPLLESVEGFRKAIRSDDMGERAAAWYQFRAYEARLKEENKGSTRPELYRRDIEECMQELKTDKEKAKEFLTAVWEQSAKVVSGQKNMVDLAMKSMDQSIPEEQRKKIAALTASLGMDMRDLTADQLLERDDLTNLEKVVGEQPSLETMKTNVEKDRSELLEDSAQAVGQWEQTDEKMPGLLQKKYAIQEESLQDISIMQKQDYQSNLITYQTARSVLSQMKGQKKLKQLNRYLAEFDRYTGEENLLYHKVRSRLLERVSGAADMLIEQEQNEEEPNKELIKAIENCKKAARKYTTSVKAYGETMETIQIRMEQAEMEEAPLQVDPQMLQDARLRVMIETMEKEKTIFSSTDFKRIAVRLKEYQTALHVNGRKGAEAQKANEAALDAVNSYLIAKLVGKMKDPETGEPINEVAVIAKDVLSAKFSLADQNEKTTGLTQEGFARLKLALKIRKILERTGTDFEDATNIQKNVKKSRQDAGKAAVGAEQEEEEKVSPLMKDRNSLYSGLYGLEALSKTLDDYTGIFAASELKKVSETMKRYLEYSKMTGADSFESYQAFGMQTSGHLEKSEEYWKFEEALDAYEKKYPVRNEAEITPVQSLVRQIRIALNETNQKLAEYFRQVLILLLGSRSPRSQEGLQKAQEQKAGAAGAAGANGAAGAQA